MTDKEIEDKQMEDNIVKVEVKDWEYFSGPLYVGERTDKEINGDILEAIHN